MACILRFVKLAYGASLPNCIPVGLNDTQLCSCRLLVNANLLYCIKAFTTMLLP